MSTGFASVTEDLSVLPVFSGAYSSVPNRNQRFSLMQKRLQSSLPEMWMVLFLAETEMDAPGETIFQLLLEEPQARQLYRELDLSLGFLWKKVPGTHLITKEVLFFESFNLLDFCINHAKFMRQLFPLKRQILLDDRLYENARSQMCH